VSHLGSRVDRAADQRPFRGRDRRSRDRRPAYLLQVELWAKGGRHVERLPFAGNSARCPPARLTIRQRYRRLTTYSGYAAEGDTARGPGGRPWLAAGVTGRLGSTGSTAVVEPRAFTTGLMRAAQEHGAVLRHGTVVDLVRRPSGAVRGVALASGEIIEGDAVVIAMGPWSILAARWLPLPAVLGYPRVTIRLRPSSLRTAHHE
jgi:glycine/D-amino acid oxidase-like deaminating enzyme